ncbi:MAG: hypothetical protein ACFFC7_19520 [Candidatus Hermodarchaeota archaeon]
MAITARKGMLIDPIEAINEKIERVFSSKSADIRKIIASPSGNYLISCSEVWEEEVKEEVLIWDTEIGIPHALEVEYSERENLKARKNNWILCVDVAVIEKKMWIICAGSKLGDIYVWTGKIDPISEEWGIERENFTYKFHFVSAGKTTPEAHADAILAVKIRKEEEAFRIYTGSKDASIKVWKVRVDEQNATIIDPTLVTTLYQPKIGEENSNWVVDLDIMPGNINLVFAGTRDKKIRLWDIKQKSVRETIELSEAVTSIAARSFEDNTKALVSASLDSKIRIWQLQNNTVQKKTLKELSGHGNSVLGIELLKHGKYVVSVSKDDTIKIWDCVRGACIRNIPISEEEFLTRLEKTNLKFNLDLEKVSEIGGTFLSHVTVSSDNRYIYVTRNNNILMIRNQGSVWHFCKQLDYIQKEEKELYEILYGENLKQDAIYRRENLDTMKELYDSIIESLKGLRSYNPAYKFRIMASMFIPSFIRFIPQQYQKEYISNVRTDYQAYWNSIRDMFHELPNFRYDVFSLYLTLDLGDISKIVEAKFFNLTEEEPIPLNDRHQPALRFLMVLNDRAIPASLIPLLDSVVISFETDRGDSVDLRFTDFVHANDICIKDVKDNVLMERKEAYYSICTLKLDEGYKLETKGHIFNKKVALILTETLDPHIIIEIPERPDIPLSTTLEKEIQIAEAFKDNFHLPIIPTIHLEIEKTRIGWFGRGADRLLARVVLVGLFASLIDILSALVFLHLSDPSTPWQYLVTYTIFAVGFLGFVFFVIAIFSLIIEHRAVYKTIPKLGNKGEK